jgi:hypothetical protein
MTTISLVNALLAGLLALFAFQAITEVSRRRARLLSKRFQSEAQSKLRGILRDAQPEERQVTHFAESLLRMISSNASMRNAARKQLELLELDRDERETSKQDAIAFRDSFSEAWQHRFESVFPYLETACMLHDPYLGPEIEKVLRKTRRVMAESSRPRVFVRVGKDQPIQSPQSAPDVPLSLGTSEAMYRTVCA